VVSTETEDEVSCERIESSRDFGCELRPGLSSERRLFLAPSSAACSPHPHFTFTNTETTKMDVLFDDFATAHSDPSGPNGYLLATTISPEAPRHDPGRLYNFRNSINQFSVRTDLQYKLQYNPGLTLDKKEAAAWLDVFVQHHKFVGSLLAAEELQNVGRTREADWARVYEDDPADELLSVQIR
jgi:hypothetical protein